jgi:hypothetical protein
MTIVLRLLHITFGVLWVGAMGLMVMYVMPAIGKAGPAGGQVMQHLMGKGKVTTYMPILGIVTVLAGFTLYYRDMHASNGTFAGSRMGMTYGIGGVSAVLALIVGGAMTGASGTKMMKISAEVAAGGGRPTPEQAAQMGALQARMKLGARITFLLMLITTITMAVARYI